MKCPNCNKEISPEWIICPFCKYEPIKCPNCDSSWLPQNAKYCPTCGFKLQNILSKEKTPKIKVYPQIQVKTTQHKSKVPKDELHKFFPIAGIVLGETMVKDILGEKDVHDYKEIDSFSHFDYGDDMIFYAKDGCITELCVISTIVDEKLFSKWKKCGVDLEMSYSKWMSFFKRRKYRIEIQESPHRVTTGPFWNRSGWLETSFCAYAPDSSIVFELEFHDFNSDIRFDEGEDDTLASLTVRCIE